MVAFSWSYRSVQIAVALLVLLGLHFYFLFIHLGSRQGDAFSSGTSRCNNDVIVTGVVQDSFQNEILLDDTDDTASLFPQSSISEFVEQRLNEAEANWKRSNAKRHHVFITGSPGFLNGLNEGRIVDERVIWDYFYPSFDCPYTVERIGRVGDGGKWICGLAEVEQKSTCIVYTFGVGNESSFQDEILHRTSCIVRIFNPTSSQPPSNIKNYSPERVTFNSFKILDEKKSNNFPTIKSLMKDNNDEFIDILKIDIYGWEWQYIEATLKDFPVILPIGQLQINVHLDLLPPLIRFIFFRHWWVSLENYGLRPFHSEPKFRGNGTKIDSEFSFLNVKSSLFLMESDTDETMEILPKIKMF